MFTSLFDYTVSSQRDPVVTDRERRNARIVRKGPGSSGLPMALPDLASM